MAIHKIILDEIRKLEENVSYCEEKLINVRPLFNEKGFFDVDQKYIDFHRPISESTHNPIWSLTVDYVFHFLKRYATSKIVPNVNYSMGIVKDYRKILEYLKQGDGEKCEKEMIIHLKMVDEYLMDMEKNHLPQVISLWARKSFRKRQGYFNREQGDFKTASKVKNENAWSDMMTL